MIEADESTEELQLEFEGMPVRGARWKLTSVADLHTDRVLRPGAHVAGSFTGRIAGIEMREKGDHWVLVHKIEVLEATLE